MEAVTELLSGSLDVNAITSTSPSICFLVDAGETHRATIWFFIVPGHWLHPSLPTSLPPSLHTYIHTYKHTYIHAHYTHTYIHIYILMNV